MGSVVTGWWARLVATWAGLLLVLSVVALFEQEPRTIAVRAAFSLVLLGFAGAAGAGLVARRRAPRVAAWLLVIGAGLPGAGFSWLLFIPPAVALFIIVSGVNTGEVRFTRPELVGAV